MSKNTVKTSLFKPLSILPLAFSSSMAIAELSFVELPLVVDHVMSLSSMDVSNNGVVSLYDTHEVLTWSVASGLTSLGNYESNGTYINQTFISDDGSVVAFNGTYAPFAQHSYVYVDGQPVNLTTSTAKIYGISPDGSRLAVQDDGKAGIYNLDNQVLDLYSTGKMIGFSEGNQKAIATTPTDFIDSNEFIVSSAGESPIDGQDKFWLLDWHPGILANGQAVIGESWGCANGENLCVARLNLNNDTIEEINMNGVVMRPLAANSDGSVIVGRGENGAVIWDDVNGVRDFKQMLLSKGLDVAEWTDFDYLEISNNGAHIVGTAINANGIKRPFIVTDVPVCTSGFK